MSLSFDIQHFAVTGGFRVIVVQAIRSVQMKLVFRLTLLYACFEDMMSLVVCVVVLYD